MILIKFVDGKLCEKSSVIVSAPIVTTVSSTTNFPFVLNCMQQQILPYSWLAIESSV
jgi:hypothetical protein